MHASAAGARTLPRRFGRAWTAICAVGLAVALVPFVTGVSMARAMGWDESMHAALPAALMAFALRAGDPIGALEVAVGCQQYPFLFPAWLAGWQALFGVGEDVMRLAARALWPMALLGVWLVTREAVRGREDLRIAPLFAMLAAALSPLLLAFSGTLFLEVPSLVVGLFAVRAFLRRSGDLPRAKVFRRELVAGAWIAAAVFTKFNYGLLLGAGLAAAWVIELVGALRARAIAPFLVRTAWLAAPVALAALWWFVLPLPGGLALGASHREAFLAFLGGNVGGTPTPWDRRLWELGTFFSAGPVALAMVAIGVAGAVPTALGSGPRVLWLVFLASALPIALHPFFLDRFLVAVGLAAWPLAGIGWARLVGSVSRRTETGAGRLASVFAPLVVVALFVVAAFHLGPRTAMAYADAIGVRTETNTEVLAIYHAERIDLRPARALPTAGLAREEHDALLDLVAAAAGPDGRVAWLGASSETSPATVHFGLLARGGSRERFLRDAPATRADGEPDFDVTWRGDDPGWDAERTRAFARRFDVVVTTDPIDVRRRRNRDFIARYRTQLVESDEFAYEELGRVDVAPPVGAVYPVRVFALRPTAR